MHHDGTPYPAYAELERRHRRLSALDGAAAVLQWDRATMMPEGGAGARAGQLAELALVAHAQASDPALAGLLEEAEAHADALDPWQAANLRWMRRGFRRATALPPALVDALSRACSEAEMRWRSARAASDFASLRPALEEVVARVRERAQAEGDAFGLAPYDALLDAHDPGRREDAITPLFARLAAVLPPLLEEVLAHQAGLPPVAAPEGPFPVAAQEALARRVLVGLHFDFAHGRLDTSHHPFTGGVPDDVRITTRYRSDEFLSSLLAVVHEAGHAQYERGLPPAWRHQPVGASLGMTIHESQSLVLEMQAGRSRPFLRHLATCAAEHFGDAVRGLDGETLVRMAHRVERGLVRVDADEVGYPLHVLLRFRLERALLRGDLAVRDLPAAWNDGMRDLLGVTPPDDRLGVLQDIHWPSGALGYFPSYTLGALAAAQLFAAARRTVPGIVEALGEGDFGPLLGWLRTRVHARGALASPDALLESATGAPLGTAAFEQHLRSRYLEEA